MPYTVACPAGLMGKTGRMTVEQLQEMARSGVTVACHTMTETDMEQDTPETLEATLQQFEAEMRRWGIRGVRSYAYVNGRYKADCLNTVKKHFDLGLTVEKGINQIPYESCRMKRVEVFPKNKSYTLEDVKAWVDKAVQDGGWLILMTHAWYTTFDAAQLKELVGYIRASGAELMDLYDALDATGNVVEAGDYQKPGADATEPFFVVDADGRAWTNALENLRPADGITNVGAALQSGYVISTATGKAIKTSDTGFRVTGVHCTDYSDASGMLLLDVQHKCWSKEMLDICGVSEAKVPKLFESWEPVGTLTAEAAAKLGLPEGVKVCAGAGDNAAAAVGCGAVGNGKCNISLGTSGTVFITSSTFGVDKQNALHSFDHADGGYHLMGCILSAASCNKWWMEDILNTQDFGKEQEPITAEKLGANDVYYLPYLMGERSPHNDPAARGSFIGLRMDSTRADMTQAVLEGVAFAIKDCVEIARAQGVEIASSTLCGGGAKSPLWREIMANILGIPLALPQTEQGPGYGGAMLAAVACGEYATVQECADKLIKIKSVTEPDPALVKKYAARYELWHKLYPALKPLYAEMEALQ